MLQKEMEWGGKNRFQIQNILHDGLFSPGDFRDYWESSGKVNLLTRTAKNGWHIKEKYLKELWSEGWWYRMYSESIGAERLPPGKSPPVIECF